LSTHVYVIVWIIGAKSPTHGSICLKLNLTFTYKEGKGRYIPIQIPTCNFPATLKRLPPGKEVKERPPNPESHALSRFYASLFLGFYSRIDRHHFEQPDQQIMRFGSVRFFKFPTFFFFICIYYLQYNIINIMLSEILEGPNSFCIILLLK
jgi:hypothetical protein